MRYADIWPRYAKYWDEAVILKSRVAEFEQEAKFALDNKHIYLDVQMATGLPWPMIATIHRRESNANFKTYLGNGQYLFHITTITPAGRGPFADFEAGAVDSVKQEGWGGVSDWRLEKILYYTMLFNGAGYEMRGLPSPYIWGGTSIQKPGKFIRDHVFDPNEMDPQPGCAPLLFMIAQMDKYVFLRETAS